MKKIIAYIVAAVVSALSASAIIISIVAKTDSAYDIAVRNGFVGTEVEWLDSLKGETGAKGETGSAGLAGAKGETGLAGQDGSDGKSAYELYLDAYPEYTGTEVEWLASLKGTDGADGEDGKNFFELAQENGFTGTEDEFYELVNKYIEEQTTIQPLAANIFRQKIMNYEYSINDLPYESDYGFVNVEDGVEAYNNIEDIIINIDCSSVSNRYEEHQLVEHISSTTNAKYTFKVNENANDRYVSAFLSMPDSFLSETQGNEPYVYNHIDEVEFNVIDGKYYVFYRCNMDGESFGDMEYQELSKEQYEYVVGSTYAMCSLAATSYFYYEMYVSGFYDYITPLDVSVMMNTTANFYKYQNKYMMDYKDQAIDLECFYEFNDDGKLIENNFEFNFAIFDEMVFSRNATFEYDNIELNSISEITSDYSKNSDLPVEEDDVLSVYYDLKSGILQQIIFDLLLAE